MGNLEYDPLFERVILVRLLWYLNDTTYRLVHSFWNQTYLNKFGCPLHPWFQTHKILKLDGLKFSDDVAKSYEYPISCKYKGLKIYHRLDHIDRKISVLFVDFASQLYLFNEIKFENQLPIVYLSRSLAKIPFHFCKDNKNHYLFVVVLINFNVVFDYSNLNNITYFVVSTVYHYDIGVFNHAFSCSMFWFKPRDLSFFDEARYQLITNDICKIPNDDYTSKSFYLSDGSFIIAKYVDSTKREVIQISSNDKVVRRTEICQTNNDLIKDVEFWNNHLYFVGENNTSVYNVDNMTRIFIINFGKSNPYFYNFVPLSNDVVVFSQDNWLKFTYLNRECSYKIRELSLVNTRSFLKLGDHSFLCYDFWGDAYLQITFRSDDLTSEIESKFEKFFDFNKI